MTDADTAGLVAAATPWIDAHLAALGIHRTGTFGEPRVRSWATVIAVPTDAGTAWFKAASTVTAHELNLYPMLVASAPGLVLHPFATDPDRAWLLLPDGGQSLMRIATGDELVARLIETAPHYARLQRATETHVTAMIDMGVPDMRPETLAMGFDEALAWSRARADSSREAATIAALSQVAALKPAFIAWCEALAASPFGPSIDHSDLHPNNILLPEGLTGGPRIYDWGDSVVAHPFSTLLVLLRSLTDQLETTPGDPRIVRVRDAYMEPFTDRATRDDLVELAEMACWTSVVIRALTWIRVLDLGSPANPEWSNAPVEWMKTFLNDSWLA